MDKAPNQFLMSSKRVKVAAAGVAILAGLTAPAAGIPRDVLPLVLICATAIIVAVILGQTLTDWASKGRTSGSNPAGAGGHATMEVEVTGAAEAARTLEGAAVAMESAADRLSEAAEKAIAAKGSISGRAALLLPLLLAGGVAAGSVGCSAISRYAEAEQRVVELTADLQEAHDAVDQAEASAAHLASALERAEAARQAALQAAQEAAQAAAAATSPEQRAELERRAAAAEAAAREAQAAAAEASLARDAAEAEADVSRRKLEDLAERVETALGDRRAAEAAAHGQANTAGAAADLMVPGAGGLVSAGALAALAIAAAYARSRALEA